MEHSSPTPETQPTKQKPWAKIGIGVAVVAALAVALYQYGDAIREALRSTLLWINDLGPLGPLLFMGLYVVVTVSFLPASLMTLFGGAIFGVVFGSIYVIIGATIGANLAFLIGRYLARERVAKLIAGNRQFQAVDRALAQGGWKIVGLIRFSPAFPFNVLNYALGLTQVSFTDNIIGTMGIIPGAIAYSYLGFLSRDLLLTGTEMMGEEMSGGSAESTITLIFNIVGLIATFAVTIYVTKLARKALRETVADETTVDPASVDPEAV